MSTCFLVLLRCGHWFRESRPNTIVDPENGEDRVCAHSSHYPGRYPAQYLIETPGFSLFDMPKTELPAPEALENAFNAWFDERYRTGITTTAKSNLLESWRAALKTVEMDR